MAATTCIISMAAGKKHNAKVNHTEELKLLVSSIRKFHPKIPVHIWLHPLTPIPGATSVESIPDLVGKSWWEKYKRAPDTAWRGKFRVINGFKLIVLPKMLDEYDSVLWLDGEAQLLQDINPLLHNTENFDIAMAQDYGDKGLCNWWNGGVIYVRNTPASRALIQHAWQLWLKESVKSEQAMLAVAIKRFRKEGRIRFKELDHRMWNVRPALANSMPISERKDVRILHTRGHKTTNDERIWTRL